MAKRQRIWTRLARIFLDRIVDARISPGITLPVSKWWTKGEREEREGQSFVSFTFDTHTRARARAVHAKVDKLGSPLPYAVSNPSPRILTEMTGAFSFSTLDKLSPTFQSARYFLHRVIRVRKSRILGASWLLTRQLNPRDPLRRAEDEVDSFR